jgi:hypothetical protein
MPKGKKHLTAAQKKAGLFHRLQRQRETMSYARGVKKGLREGWVEGWDAAMAERNQRDEKAVLALASIPPKPLEKLAPEATNLEAVDATIIQEGPYMEMVDRVVKEIPQKAIKRLMTPMSLN